MLKIIMECDFELLAKLEPWNFILDYKSWTAYIVNCWFEQIIDVIYLFVIWKWLFLTGKLNRYINNTVLYNAYYTASQSFNI